MLRIMIAAPPARPVGLERFLTVHPHYRDSDGSGAQRTPALVRLHRPSLPPTDSRLLLAAGTSRVSTKLPAVAAQRVSVSRLGAPRKKMQRKLDPTSAENVRLLPSATLPRSPPSTPIRTTAVPAWHTSPQCATLPGPPP